MELTCLDWHYFLYERTELWCTVLIPILTCVVVLLPHQQAILRRYLPGDSVKYYRLRVQSYRSAPPCDFRCQLQVQVAPVLLTYRLLIGGSNNPLLGFD